VTTIPLGRLLPAASSNQPGRRGWSGPEGLRPRVIPIRSCSRWGLPCRDRCRPRGALLPHLFTLTCHRNGRRYRFLWHFPWGRPRRPLTGTVSPWSPDFPPVLRPAAVQPTGMRCD